MTVQHIVAILQFLYSAILAYVETPAGQAELLTLEQMFTGTPTPAETQAQAVRNATGPTLPNLSR